MELEDEDRPAIERVLAATRGGARIIAIEAATTAAGVAIAQVVIAESAPAGAASIWIAAPRMDEPFIVEEVAALVVLELCMPSAPREDEAGLVDAAAEALRHAAPPFTIFTEAETWLANGGTASLATWADETTTTFIVVTTAGVAGLPEGTVRVAVELRSEAGMAEVLERRWDVLTDREREIAKCLVRCPVAIPASSLALAVGAETGSALDALSRDGVITMEWAAGALFVRLSADARRIQRQRGAGDDDAHAIDGRLAGAVCRSAAHVLEGGEPPTYRDAELLARQRAHVRALLPRARETGGSSIGELTLVAMTAMEPLGPLLEICAAASRALREVDDVAMRARLEERHARVLRDLGRFDEAVGCVERAAPHAALLPPRAAGRLAVCASRLAVPEREWTHVAERAEAIATGLSREDPLVAGLVAFAHSALAWHGVSAEAAIAPMIDAVIGFGQAGHEQLELAALAALTAHHLGALRIQQGAKLARQLERASVRFGRTEITAIAQGYRGCLALAADDVPEAIRLLSASIDRLSALGYRNLERWGRAHRGLAMLAGGRMIDATRDFDDFVAMTRIVGGSDLVGVIGGALAGSQPARERLLALADDAVPAYLRAVVRAVRVIVTDAPASKAIAGELHGRPPGYFAFEVLQLERATLRATSAAPVVTAAPGSREMLVARDASWFELEGEARVSLGRTRTLRHLLQGFVHAHTRGRALDLEDVFVLGWPGERASNASRGNRVHVTLSRLRAVGLGESLMFGDGGWRLDPALRVVSI